MLRLPSLAAWTLLLAVAPHGPAFAWGADGHAIVGLVADRFLTEAARGRVERLLEGERQLPRTLAGVSGWADDVRPRRPETRPWHYVNIDIRAPGYDAPRDCPKGDCIVAQVKKFAVQLADDALLPPVRLEALKFLIHFVGDLHQPLHAGDNGDQGGNAVEVVFRDGGSNLHRVWDSQILAAGALGEMAAEDLAAELAEAVTPEERSTWERGGPVEWTDESHAVARDEIYAELGSAARRGGTDAPVVLGRAYADDHLPVVKRQLQRAGVRLALMLNRALD
jgi:hypothetical protein